MACKLALEEGKEETQETLKKALPRPMSVLSDKFFRQHVTKVEGTLELVNKKLFPNLPLDRDKIAKELSLFVDWIGKDVEIDLNGLKAHGRSLSFNVMFSDKYGNIYKYIALKGSGIPERSAKAVEYHEPIKRDNEGMWGLQELLGARSDWDTSNEFLKNGIQTSGPIAIIRLNSVTMKNGEKKTVEELKKEGIIRKDIPYDGKTYEYIPVIYLIGYSEVMRAVDTQREDCDKFVKENGMKDRDEYLDWWTRKVAKNVAAIHNLGKVHGYLSDHNITLDGCIVDNDSVSSADGYNGKKPGANYAEDVGDVLRLLRGFYVRMKENPKGVEPTVAEFQEKFLRAYFEARGEMKKTEFRGLSSRLRVHDRIDPEILRVIEEAYEKRFNEKF